MSVILKGSCPPMQEVLRLGRECGLIYGLLWEAAFRDVRGDCGGITTWSVKGIAGECGMGKATVVQGLKKLLDAGFIQYAGKAWGSGSWKRRWRVTHPDQLEAVRHAIEVMGLPSLKYNDTLTGKINDTTEAHEQQTREENNKGSEGVGKSNC